MLPLAAVACRRCVCDCCCECCCVCACGCGCTEADVGVVFFGAGDVAGVDEAAVVGGGGVFNFDVVDDVAVVFGDDLPKPLK